MEKKRKTTEAIQESLRRVTASGAIKKIIPPRDNDDVTRFLNRLDKCEEEDRKIKFLVK